MRNETIPIVLASAIAKARKRLSRQCDELEQAFEAALVDLAASCNGELPFPECDVAIEDLILQEEFAGQFVAFCDCVRETREGPRFHRTVVAHSAEYAALAQQLDCLDSRERHEIQVCFKAPPVAS